MTEFWDRSPDVIIIGSGAARIHGAGRLGGCALTECIVFGRIAGRHAATTE
jgi:predicted oxidoreductase